MKRLPVLLFVLIALALAGCQKAMPQEPTATATVTVTPIPATATLTLTSMPPTATPTDADTPTPEPTPTQSSVVKRKSVAAFFAKCKLPCIADIHVGTTSLDEAKSIIEGYFFDTFLRIEDNGRVTFGNNIWDPGPNEWSESVLHLTLPEDLGNKVNLIEMGMQGDYSLNISLEKILQTYGFPDEFLLASDPFISTPYITNSAYYLNYRELGFQVYYQAENRNTAPNVTEICYNPKIMTYLWISTDLNSGKPSDYFFKAERFKTFKPALQVLGMTEEAFLAEFNEFPVCFDTQTSIWK